MTWAIIAFLYVSGALLMVSALTIHAGNVRDAMLYKLAYVAIVAWPVTALILAATLAIDVLEERK